MCSKSLRALQFAAARNGAICRHLCSAECASDATCIKTDRGGGDPAGGGGSDYSRYLAEWSEGVPQCVSFDLRAEVTDEYVKMLWKDKGNTLIFTVLRHFLYDIYVP